MSPEAQRVWNRDQRALEDLEYQADRAREDAENSARREKHAKEMFKRELDYERARSVDLDSEVSELQQQLADVLQYLADKHLLVDFKNWDVCRHAQGGVDLANLE